MRVYDTYISEFSTYIIDNRIDQGDVIRGYLPENSRIISIDEAEDLISEIANALQNDSLKSIHVFTHGSAGEIAFSGGTINARTLLARAGEFHKRTQAGCDLFLYGCEIGSGTEGAAFVSLLSDLTGFNVSASSRPVGAAELGGQWDLDVRSGTPRARPLSVPDYPGLLAAPTLGGLQPLALAEGDTVALAPSLTVSGGSSYSGGSITFAVGSAQTGDQLSLLSDGDVTAAGAISVQNGTVYYGTGSDRIQVGVVDTIENGLNGQPLTIRFVREFINAGFESGTTGWTVGTQQVVLGTTYINGILTPTDPTIAPNSNGDDTPPSSFTYSHQISASEYSEGAHSLRLFSSGTTGLGFDVVHGPYAYSNTFSASTGDTFTLDWRAVNGGDAFDVFGYLMNADGSQSIVVINATGASASATQPWTEVSVTVPNSGNWFFVFVAGTYDFSGGRAAGGSLYIDNFRVGIGGLTDAVVSAIAGNVSYHADDEAPTARALTVSVADGAGDVETITASVSVANVNARPTGSVTLVGILAEDQTLSLANSLSDEDGIGSGFTYQWQSLGADGTWSNITGATAATFTLTQSQLGLSVRAVVRYVDGDGVLEQVTTPASSPIANVNDLPVGDVTLQGYAARNQILVAQEAVTDEDGRSESSFRWQRLGADGVWRDIDGAVGSTHRLTAADVGFRVRAVLDYVDGQGTAEHVASTPTDVVAAANSAPVVAADMFTLPVGQDAIRLDLTANDSDADGDRLTITQINGQDVSLGQPIIVSGGTVERTADDHILFTPFLTHGGTVSFTYTLSDAMGGTATGQVTGNVEQAGAWQDSVGPAITQAQDVLGLSDALDINGLIYIASVVAPGALDTRAVDLATPGYIRAPGTELTQADLSPDSAQLLSSVITIWLAQSSSVLGIAVADGDGVWRSSVEQSLLFQTELATAGNVGIAYGTDGADLQGLPTTGWTRSLALQSLRPDFSEETVKSWDRYTQGHLLQNELQTDTEIGVNFDGAGGQTPQAALTAQIGLLDFMNADSTSAVTVARPVAIAQTIGGDDDQVALVQMRQNGTYDVSLMLYRVDDLVGTINGVRAGDAGYADAAVSRAYATQDGSLTLQGGGYGKFAENRIVGVDNGDIIAMRLTTSAGGEFYSFASANSDGAVTHLWNYGLNVWGWEDVAGGGDRDFNDLVVRLDFVSAQLDTLLG